MTKDANPALRLATWNIRAGLGTDLRRDPFRVLARIAALAADVVVLQEADFRLGRRPSALPVAALEEATGLLPLPVGAHPGSLGWHGNAILVRRGLSLAGLSRLDLPGHEPRGAVIADLDGAPGPLRIVAVHLGLLRAARRRQADAIRAALGQHPARPTVIAGDFNERSRQVGLGRIARWFHLVAPQPTFPSRLPHWPLDRIAHSPDLDVTPVLLPRLPGPQPSDHLPLLAEVRWA